ncbi:hypothetical protein [Streptomyces boncukensis]|uniref:hypothetical protein n=1 Tax=Streptomyces boncukensis TaxID=2711219 RepID=UPI003B97B376
MSARVPDEDGPEPELRPEHLPTRPDALQCPSCGSSNVAQVLGDNGGVSYVCTACGHIWS